MTDKERFDTLMALAEFRLKRIFNRRDYEWKVTLGVWALFAAGIWQASALKDPASKLLTTVAIVGISFLLVRFWIQDHWKKSEDDWELAFWFAETAEAMLSLESISPPIPKGRGLEVRRRLQRPSFLYSWPSMVQAIVTVVLALLLIVRLW